MNDDLPVYAQLIPCNSDWLLFERLDSGAYHWNVVLALGLDADNQTIYVLDGEKLPWNLHEDDFFLLHISKVRNYIAGRVVENQADLGRYLTSRDL